MALWAAPAHRRGKCIVIAAGLRNGAMCGSGTFATVVSSTSMTGADESLTPFAAVLRAMRAHLGIGVVLNTSFNIHGAPLVGTPEEAIAVLIESGADALAIGPFPR